MPLKDDAAEPASALDVARRVEYAERVRPAIALIKPKSKETRDACWVESENAFVEIEFMRRQLRDSDFLQTKQAKRAARRLGQALQHVETVLKDKELDFAVRKFFPKVEFSKWKSRCDELANTPSRKLKRKGAEAKRHAVSQAHLLMQKYASPEAAADARKGSRFCRLAALLLGCPKSDLHNQCKSILRKKRVPK